MPIEVRLATPSFQADPSGMRWSSLQLRNSSIATLPSRLTDAFRRPLCYRNLLTPLDLQPQRKILSGFHSEKAIA
jgi:hypothetical protein